ncbi:MAG: transposase [Proteobacteria bacterium]|nr:transposase [Pseudomonadota bacterium]
MSKFNQFENRKYRKKVNVVNADDFKGYELDGRIELIQALIPLGLMFVAEELQKEVQALAGPRYSRGDYVRYGNNPGSVVLAGQRIGIEVPRVRNQKTRQEKPLKTYHCFHKGNPISESVFVKLLKGLSCNNYEEAVQKFPEAFGLSSSSISRHFVKASKEKLRELLERDLSQHNFVAIVLDGKSFQGQDMIVALGVTIEGNKLIMGFIESATENETVVMNFMQGLLDRGLSIDEGILVVTDGSKGLHSGVKKVFKNHVLFQRCQWHKRKNVSEHFSKAEQPFIKKRMQRAYERPTYDEAKKSLNAIRKDFEDRNLSAVSSLDEGFEETLTLHRLGLFPQLGISLKTTNCLESINAQVEQICGRVDNWQNSSQRQRWLASALLDIEKRLRIIKGYKFLPQLKAAIKSELKLDKNEIRKAA